jgi:hypothetical protein
MVMRVCPPLALERKSACAATHVQRHFTPNTVHYLKSEAFASFITLRNVFDNSFIIAKPRE